MKCPNCGREQADGSAECSSCQVIFAKWAKAHPLTTPDMFPEAVGGRPAGKIGTFPVWPRYKAAILSGLAAGVVLWRSIPAAAPLPASVAALSILARSRMAALAPAPV